MKELRNEIEIIDLKRRIKELEFDRESNSFDGTWKSILMIIFVSFILWTVARFMHTSECFPTLTHTQILRLQRQQWNQEGFLSRPFDSRCWSPEKGYYEMPEEK